MERMPGSYRSQIEEVEAIVASIQNGAIDVDVLTRQVERARELITDCRRRLRTTSTTVQRIMDDVSGRATPADDDEGDWDPGEWPDPGGPAGVWDFDEEGLLRTDLPLDDGEGGSAYHLES